jgi:hypothetical protein
MGGQGGDPNKLTKVLGFVFPTIALLPGADKDLPAGLRCAKRLQTSAGAVDPYEMLLPGQRTTLAQPRAAQDFRRRLGVPV